jgi:hypothetical protein
MGSVVLTIHLLKLLYANSPSPSGDPSDTAAGVHENVHVLRL